MTLTDETRHPIDLLNDAADLDMTEIVIMGYDRRGNWCLLTTEHPLHAQAIAKRAYVTLEADAEHTPALVLHS